MTGQTPQDAFQRANNRAAAAGFVGAQRDFTVEVVRRELPALLQETRIFGRGTITAVGVNSTVQLARTEEPGPDGKFYPILAHYSPVVGDDVLLARVGTTWVVLGKIRHT